MSDNENWTPDSGGGQAEAACNDNANATFNAENPGQEPPQFAFSPSLTRAAVERKGDMDDYDVRLQSFVEHKWNSKLSKSTTTNPASMAAKGFYCTGTDSAKCYVCLKDLEGWVATDSPAAEHAKHCQHCLLVQLRLPAFGQRTWRQELRLRVAMEFQERRKQEEAYCSHTRAAFVAVDQKLAWAVGTLKRGDELETDL